MSNRQEVRWEGCRKFWRPALFWVCTWGKLEKQFFYFVPKILPPPPYLKAKSEEKKVFLAIFWHFALDRSDLQYLFWAIYRCFDWCWWLGLGWGLSFTTTRLQNNPWCRGEDKEMWRHLPLSLLQVASCGLVVHSWCWDFFSCQNHSELQRNYKRMDIILVQFVYVTNQIVTFEEDENCPPDPGTCEAQWSFLLSGDFQKSAQVVQL